MNKKDWFYLKEIILDEHDRVRILNVMMVPDKRLAETNCLAYENHVLNKRVYHADTKKRPGIILGALVWDITRKEVIMTISSPAQFHRYSVHILYMVSEWSMVDETNEKIMILPLFKGSYSSLDEAIHKAGIHYMTHTTWGYGGGIFVGVTVTDNQNNDRIYQKIR